ncbi:lipoxygenase homology domain-containing protein 1 [Elysia marginata]|uniref:Lipoxygenase homology domain-containing protein 1 n=1 Tax=Elysia marginata TaxID=1093978 RepID=A0AAV4FZG3_9GAST|nr:lipoxygenase homology domain-containing protein 1 [Elysia marginata]
MNTLGFPYVITVKTGDRRGAATDARVYVILYGNSSSSTPATTTTTTASGRRMSKVGPQPLKQQQKQSSTEETSGKIWLDNGDFERGREDLFKVDVAKKLSPMTKIEVGHDGSGVGPGWFLDYVTVFCPGSGIEQYFPCNKWLASDEGDGLICRTLYEQKGMRKKKEKQISWQCWVMTSDIKSAGTDANVHIVLYGDKGKTDDILLTNKGDSFEKGNMDTFRFNSVDVGKPYKLRVWHDNEGSFAGWHLDKIELESLEGKERFTFPCDRWLAEDEDDKEIVREIPAEAPSIKKPLPGESAGMG